ncbi:MAG: RHS domain-containing protein [Byssovorax sp.]
MSGADALFSERGGEVRYGPVRGPGSLAKYTDPLGQVTRMEYGGTGVLTRVEQPDGRVWSFSYTGQERLAAIKNPRGEVHAFTYDDVGRVVQETTFDGRALACRYDVAGRIDRVDYPDGTWRAFPHDRLGNLVGDDSPDGTIRYRRARFGRLLGGALDEQGDCVEVHFELDELGRLVSDAQGDRRVRYAYDARGRRIGRTMPDISPAQIQLLQEERGEVLTVVHDHLGMPKERIDPAGQIAWAAAHGAWGSVTETYRDPASEQREEVRVLFETQLYPREGRRSKPPVALLPHLRPARVAFPRTQGAPLSPPVLVRALRRHPPRGVRRKARRTRRTWQRSAAPGDRDPRPTSLTDLWAPTVARETRRLRARAACRHRARLRARQPRCRGLRDETTPPAGSRWSGGAAWSEGRARGSWCRRDPRRGARRSADGIGLNSLYNRVEQVVQSS